MNRTIVLLLALTAVTWAAAVRTGSSTENVIRVTAKKFAFTPSEIRVKRGEPLVLELTSTDRGHGFSLPDLGVDAKMKPGEITRVSFTPNKAGKFSFVCDVFCGSGHDEMSGTLVVTE
ncbi:MAG: cupredoxin domain-containing protein [Acidobacteria bacterium]|nr:cupredoxin domain-containing protein [Acidobacteriota bacterium]MBI3423243.1 cupredoxin domain-containing protein [Acidobacteriota bacterium]